ncbi:MAG: ribosomal RNA small subunit methyltransferase A [Chlamydiia bacterium]|nr:ribosomal RNA small subunit methyltransferase A [Chlamydiia bacterium]
MPLYKPSELFDFLNERGIQPKKGLSQNFLIDGNILRKMVESANVQENETIIEIGPGPGALTEALLAAGARVIAIEKDEALGRDLERLQNGKLDILIDDFRNIRFSRLIKSGEKAKVIANIPYSLTGVILQELLPKHEKITTIHLMVQKEVAERCTASPNTKDYSSFTLFTHYHAIPKYLFTVSKNCFYPKPKVDSAVLQLTLIPPPVEVPYAPFFAMVKEAFQMRRKMLRASLKKYASPEKIEATLQLIGKNKTARPQELSLADFSSFWHFLHPDEEVNGQKNPDN